MKGVFLMNDILRVAAYCRVSTDKTDQLNSLDSQIIFFTNYISSQSDWQMSEVYFDEGISGTSIKKRAGFNTMINDAALGKFDLILTKEVSRFARNTVDTLSFTRRLKELGIGVLFMNDNINTMDSDGELRLSIMASIAQEESRKTSQRVKWGQRQRMEQGAVFGRDLLGYFVHNGRLIINPDEAPTVKLIFHKFLNEEKGTHIIARELNEALITPKRVHKWSGTTILRVLRNEKYAGDLCQMKTYTPDYLSHAKKSNTPENMIYLTNHHDAIIDKEVWNRTQAELKRRAPSSDTKAKHSNRYWCSGKIICGKCGSGFVSRTKKLKNGSIYRAWRCYMAANHGRTKVDNMGNYIGCDSSSVNDKTLSLCANYAIKHLLENKTSLINEIIGEINSLQISNTHIDTNPFFAEIKTLQSKKQKAIDLTLNGTINCEDLKLTNIFYDEKIEKLTTQIANAEAINKNRPLSNGIDIYINEINHLLEFDSINQLLLRETLEKIIIADKNLIIIYLKSVPVGIRLNCCISGKMDKFNVEIYDMNILLHC